MNALAESNYATTRRSGASGEERICCNIPSQLTNARGIGLLVRCTELGLFQLVMTDTRKRNFNNPHGHGGDVNYLCLTDMVAAEKAADEIAKSDAPDVTISRIRHFIREEGEHAYLEQCYQ